METRAPFIVIGAFVLAALGALFGFVYWLNSTGGLGKRDLYRVQFEGSVPGLLVGAAVLFNGIKVGEVVGLGLAADNPRRVDATIAVAQNTPVRKDTRVGLDFQGLTGVPVVALEGGEETSSRDVGVLVAEPGAGQSVTQAARDALRRVDAVLQENSGPLRATIASLQTFSEGLAKNTPRLDGIIAGVERMTGAVPAPRKVAFDLKAASNFPQPRTEIRGQLVVPEPTAVVMFDTQRFLFEPGMDLSNFADAQWSDTLPKLLQAKVLQSFENYDMAHPPLRDDTDGAVRLLLDVRQFRIAGDAALKAEIGFSAKLIDKSGRVVAARLFEATRSIDGREPLPAVAAFDRTFEALMDDLVPWVVSALQG
jgi:phospholipid/cholesterol/gamma-HCH transport system substrate-binding protein